MFKLLSMMLKSYQTGIPVYIQQLEQELDIVQLTNKSLKYHTVRNRSIHDLIKSLDYGKLHPYIPEPLKEIHEVVSKYGYASLIMAYGVATRKDEHLPNLSVEVVVYKACYVFSDHSVYIFMESLNEQANTGTV